MCCFARQTVISGSDIFLITAPACPGRQYGWHHRSFRRWMSTIESQVGRFPFYFSLFVAELTDWLDSNLSVRSNAGTDARSQYFPTHVASRSVSTEWRSTRAKTEAVYVTESGHRDTAAVRPPFRPGRNMTQEYSPRHNYYLRPESVSPRTILSDSGLTDCAAARVGWQAVDDYWDAPEKKQQQTNNKNNNNNNKTTTNKQTTTTTKLVC